MRSSGANRRAGKSELFTDVLNVEMPRQCHEHVRPIDARQTAVSLTSGGRAAAMSISV